MKIQHKGDYAKRRAAEYPAISGQLDALWHAMDRGELQKVPEFYDPIKAVKLKYAKPAILQPVFL